MRRRRRSHVQENPSTTTVLAIGAGVALLGVAAFFMLRKPTAPTPPPQVVASNAPQLPPGRPFGDPADGNSVAHACNVAWQLTAIGHPTQAAVWAQKCIAAGAVVPNSAAQQYT
jgi:hypothetical protein